MENSQLSNYIKLPQLYWEEQTLFREVLMKRRSIRFFQSTEITIQEVSNILIHKKRVKENFTLKLLLQQVIIRK